LPAGIMGAGIRAAFAGDDAMRRFSVRALMGSVVWLAVALAVLKNGNELGLGMVLLVGLAALGTRWPYRVHPENAEK
jgi:hypothetical protein